ncbi:MAG: guanylate cyclase [Mesorhizobium sp.]|nr:MAG: guanylate cyclase [Mesorhizobium sp.]
MVSWNETRARSRITQLQTSAPVAAIGVRNYNAFLFERTSLRDQARARGQQFNEPIFAVPLNRAVLTHGVHIYANLTAFNDRLIENGRETEASHRRSMQFLHGHYEACDRLIAAFGIQRVDFHGGRLHAVVLAPTGPENEADRLQTALAFAAALREMVARLSDRYGGEFQTGVRIGIDTGPAVAVNSGRRGELEPLFIGSPANHAAKAAAGTAEGIYLTERAQAVLNTSQRGDRVILDTVYESAMLSRDIVVNGNVAPARSRVDEAFDAFNAARRMAADVAFDGRRAEFTFHHRQPPLRTIDYANHPPSNAIRMPLASLFADIFGFTDYIDNAMRTGTVAQAVGNLHVLRGEMNYVARDDFDGRKVRYIGDCLHALIAEGDTRNTDERATVRTAVLAAAGIRSSFELCRTILPNIGELGIAIGVELGPTPIARLGLVGEASVRWASSRATCKSEEIQGACRGNETNIGPAAHAAADPHIRRVFVGGQPASGLNYPATVALLAGASASVAAVSAAAAAPIFRSSPPPMRAYARGKAE